MEKSFRRIRPISRLDESTYKWTKRLQNIRIESCWLVNAANDGPQKRISSLPLFQSSLNHRPFLRPALFRTRDVLSKFGKIVEAKFPDPIPDRSAKMTKRLKNCELRKNFETNIASQFQFYFSRMECVFSGNLKRRAVIGQRSRTRENFIPLELAKWRKGNIFLNPIEDRELCSNV